MTQELVISRAELKELGEYSCSLPTGTFVGKRWRRNVMAYRPVPVQLIPCLPHVGHVAEWKVAEYVPDPEPGMIGIKWWWAVDENHNLIRGEL